MRVVLKTEVFAGTSLADLLPFLWLGATGRHRILVEDARSELYCRWLDALPEERLRADWVKVTDDGLRLDATEPSHHEIRVTVRQDSAWSLPVPSLRLADALDLLQRPYRILVENGISDGAFLLCMCPPRERAWLEARVGREWVEIEHCGGIDHIRKRVGMVRKDEGKAIRCSALFDSDALRPGKPSAASEATKQACHPDVHHHQLLRRAIENYLPRAALEVWIKLAEARKRRHRQAVVEALFRMSADQRAHYNMKEGFGGDDKQAGKAGETFAGLDPRDREALRGGLAEDVATLYQHGYVRWEDLDRSEPLQRKLIEFIEELVARVR